MDIQEFYKDKEKRDLIDTITTAKWVTEEQKAAIIDILAEDADDDMDEDEDIDLEDLQRVDVVLVPFDETALGHGAVADRHDLGQRAFGEDETADVLG